MRELPRTTHRSGRSGRTLIEMMVIIAVLSSMMFVASALIVLMAKAERSAARGLYANATLLRLARTFRDDVRSAGSVQADEQSLLMTGGPGGAVSYSDTAAGTLRRREVAGSDIPHRDLFRNVHLRQWSLRDTATTRPGTLIEVRIEWPRNATAEPISALPHEPRELTLISVNGNSRPPQSENAGSGE